MRFDPELIAAQFWHGQKRPPSMLPFAYRGHVPFTPAKGAWPSTLDAPPGVGLFTTWFPYGDAANDERAATAVQPLSSSGVLPEAIAAKNQPGRRP